MATVEKMPMLAEGYEKLNAELRAEGGAAPDRRRDRGSARARRPVGKCRISRREGTSGSGRGTIADLEDKLSRAQIIDPTTLSGDKIVFGATVTLLDEDDKPVRYQIVGHEADAKLGMISYN
jgi:transcription elongation factor GreA